MISGSNRPGRRRWPCPSRAAWRAVATSWNGSSATSRVERRPRHRSIPLPAAIERTSSPTGPRPWRRRALGGRLRPCRTRRRRRLARAAGQPSASGSYAGSSPMGPDRCHRRRITEGDRPRHPPDRGAGAGGQGVLVHGQDASAGRRQPRGAGDSPHDPPPQATARSRSSATTPPTFPGGHDIAVPITDTGPASHPSPSAASSSPSSRRRLPANELAWDSTWCTGRSSGTTTGTSTSIPSPARPPSRRSTVGWAATVPPPLCRDSVPVVSAAERWESVRHVGG